MAPVINGVFFHNDSAVNTSWTLETSVDRPVENVFVIIKECVSLPCEIKDPQNLEDDEKELSIDTSSLEHLFSDSDPSKAHAVVVCAENSLGRNCSDSLMLDAIDTITEPVIIPLGVNPRNIYILISVLVILGLLVCCFIWLILCLIIFFWCKREKETAYWPGIQ